MPGGAPQGYTGQVSLGGATFTLGVDEGAYNQALDRAEQAARKASGAIGQSLGRGGDAAMGLLYLGNAVDDLQYGFRAIVNNIPQLTMALGAGAGVAGAVGIAAVATQQLASHWEELADLFRSDFAREQAEAMAELAEKTKDAADQAEKLLKATPSGRAAAGQAINKAAVEEGAENVLGAIETALLRETPASGKGKGIFNAMLAGLGLGTTQAQDERRAIKDKAAYLLGAMGKDEGARAQVEGLFRRNTPEFAGVPNFVRTLMENAPGVRAEAGMLNRAGAENEAILKNKMAADKIADEKERAAEAERKAKERQIADWQKANDDDARMALRGREDQLRGQLAAAQEASSMMRPSQMFGSVRDFLSSVTTSGADQVRKQQLDVQKGIKRELEKIREEIADIGQARFAQ